MTQFIRLSAVLLILANNYMLNSEEINCNIVNSHDSTSLCSIYNQTSALNIKETSKFNYLKSSSSSMHSIGAEYVPFHIDIKSGDLIWQNKHEPSWTRWSKLCPSSRMSPRAHSNTNYPQVYNYCSNHLTCDLTGVCEIKFQLDNSTSVLIVNLRDTINKNTETPKFTNELSLINVTFDLDEASLTEQILIENTVKLDTERSKSIRSANIFKFDMVLPSFNSEQYNFYCKSNDGIF